MVNVCQVPGGICSGPLHKLGNDSKMLHLVVTEIFSFFCLQFLWISLSLFFPIEYVLVLNDTISDLFSK